jgi:hypothetical protein
MSVYNVAIQERRKERKELIPPPLAATNLTGIIKLVFDGTLYPPA